MKGVRAQLRICFKVRLVHIVIHLEGQVIIIANTDDKVQETHEEQRADGPHLDGLNSTYRRQLAVQSDCSTRNMCITMIDMEKQRLEQVQS